MDAAPGASEARPKGTRRTHTKSRQGCIECKRRKVKCNEEKPSCAGCSKRSIPCLYPSEHDARDGDFSAPSLRPNWTTAQRHSGSISPNEGGYAPPTRPAHPRVASYAGRPPDATIGPIGLGQFGMDDMVLWHHFVTATATTIISPWSKELPLQALNCDYLMHGILATAGLHLAFLHPDLRDRYHYQSANHQDLALRPFRQAISEITAENCNQVFAFSILLIVFNYASFRSLEYLLPFTTATGYKGLSNWIICLRGCYSIFQEARTHVLSGSLGFLVPQEDWASTLTDPLPSSPSSKDDQSLQNLAENLLNLPDIKSSTSSEILEAYKDAISSLRQLFLVSSRTTDVFSKQNISSFWPSTISDTFIWLLNEHKPPALLIMGHYCLLLRKCEECWYIKHRAYDLFQAVQHSLPEEWFVYLEYPLQVFNGCS